MACTGTFQKEKYLNESQTGEVLVNEIAPLLQALQPSLNPIGAEDQAEQVQDAIVIAAALLISAEKRGKQASAGQSKTDAMATQLAGRSSVVSLDASISSAEQEEPMCLHDVLAARTEDPATAASRNLDWAPLLGSLDRRAGAVLRCLAEGRDLTALVPKLKRARTTLQNDKNRLAALVKQHLGEDILARVQEQPRWRDNVEAGREKVACRYDREAV